MPIYILLVFLAGMIFNQWIIPFIDGLLGNFLQQLEVYKQYMVEKITKSSFELTKLKNDLEKEDTPVTNPIGFVIQTEEEDEKYDEFF